MVTSQNSPAPQRACPEAVPGRVLRCNGLPPQQNVVDVVHGHYDSEDKANGGNEASGRYSPCDCLQLWWSVAPLQRALSGK